jgi:glycosyltransferase involved in cell wall biosynthesis
MLPGIEGMVISEAMAYSLPVIAYQADGTEYDPIQNGVNGIRLNRGDSTEITEAIEPLQKNPGRTNTLGVVVNRFIREEFKQENMVLQIARALEAAFRHSAAQAG